MPPKWCARSFGAKGIDLGKVGEWPSSMILVFWLDFVTRWCVGWKTKIMVLKNWLDSILTNASKVMWENFESKRNWSWHGWCIAKFHDFGVFAWFCDLVVYGVKNENHGVENLAGLSPHKCLQSEAGKLWGQKELILAWLVHSKVHYFGVLPWFCDLVVCWVKNKNHGFRKLAILNPHKFLQSDVGEVWEQKEFILAWLVHSQVP